MVKKIIDNFILNNSYMEDKGLLWDCLKCEIRGQTVSYSSALAQERRKTEKELMDKISVLESDLDESCVDEYNSYKSKLERLYTIKTKGSMIRSKAKFIKFNEKPTKYFFNTENVNYKNKHIRKLIIDKETITCPDRILREERLFYKQLYSEQCLDDVSHYDQLTLFDDLPSLDTKDMSFCDRPISLEEITYSRQQLSNNKTPGSDGFTAEFYKFFWPQIKDIVFDSFVYAYNTELSIEQRHGILNIIPKKEKRH